MTPAIIWAGAAIVVAALLVLAALKAWQGWLDLKYHSIAADQSPQQYPTPAARIEMADIKERLRRLEAIATGVDL